MRPDGAPRNCTIWPLSTGSRYGRCRNKPAGNASHLHPPLPRTRRRLLATQNPEFAGLGLLVGSAAAAILLPLLLLQGRPLGAFAIGLPVVGVFCGVAWALIRGSSLLAAAVLIDRQLNLDDLLASAASAGQSDDPW